MRLVVSALVAAFAAVGYIAVGSQQVANPTTPGIIAGIVVDDAGKVVAKATVDLRTGQTILRTTVTDSRGAFRFENVTEGTYEVHAAAPGLLDSTSTLTVAKGRPVRALRLLLRAAPAPAAAPVPAPPPPASISAEMPMASPATAARVGGALGGQIAHDEMSYQLKQQSADFNTEAYDKIDEHRFRRVADDPLSTFSIDVDTASYSNVRRFLNAGTLPPADAVRIEELINYFRFSYTQLAGRMRRSRVTTEVAACPWNPRHRLALVGAAGAARSSPDARRRATSCSCSTCPARWTSPTSCRWSRPRCACSPTRSTARDRVAIVVYAGASGLALPSTPATSKAEIQRAIAELQAGGSTNGAAGIQLAYDMAAAALHQGRHQPRHPRDRRRLQRRRHQPGRADRA